MRINTYGIRNEIFGPKDLKTKEEEIANNTPEPAPEPSEDVITKEMMTEWVDNDIKALFTASMISNWPTDSGVGYHNYRHFESMREVEGGTIFCDEFVSYTTNPEALNPIQGQFLFYFIPTDTELTDEGYAASEVHNVVVSYAVEGGVPASQPYDIYIDSVQSID